MVYIIVHILSYIVNTASKYIAWKHNSHNPYMLLGIMCNDEDISSFQTKGNLSFLIDKDILIIDRYDKYFADDTKIYTPFTTIVLANNCYSYLYISLHIRSRVPNHTSTLDNPISMQHTATYVTYILSLVRSLNIDNHPILKHPSTLSFSYIDMSPYI